ncbi:ABC transporter substrate-binding protein [Cohnella faecalis]|uniref:ABC transporter substrate-binding protein n=1 Tax=Cohnella faecalis TaxID=2315694 RepID=UPI00131495DE|nr:extracellular solute-binding protein [Cohnella faecalis]
MKSSKASSSLILLLCLLLLSACSQDGKKLKPFDPKKSTRIKIMYDSPGYYDQDYGRYLSAKYPNLEVEVASTDTLFGKPSSEYKKFIQNENPDVLLLTPDLYEEYVLAGKLMPLDELITQDAFDIENIQPFIVEYLKEKGEGKIYGLANSFYSLGLYYNIDLFRKHGIETPRNGMTWEEVAALAGRFPHSGSGDDRVYGLQVDGDYSPALNLLLSLTGTQNLRLVDKDGSKLLLDTASVKSAYEKTVDMLASGSLYADPIDKTLQIGDTLEGFLERDPFLMNKVAMTIRPSWYMSDIRGFSSGPKKHKPASYGVATVPVDPSNPGASAHVGLSKIFCVSASASNPGAAWEFVKYVNGGELAAIKSKTDLPELPARTAAKEDKDGRSLEAFYSLKPNISFHPLTEDVPRAFLLDWDKTVSEQTTAAIEGKISSEAALKSIQSEGQAKLAKAGSAESKKS